MNYFKIIFNIESSSLNTGEGSLRTLNQKNELAGVKDKNNLYQHFFNIPVTFHYKSIDVLVTGEYYVGSLSSVKPINEIRG